MIRRPPLVGSSATTEEEQAVVSVLTLLLALFVWLFGPFAPLVPLAQIGVVAVAGAFVVYETEATAEARPIEPPAPAANEPHCADEPAIAWGRGQERAGDAVNGVDAPPERGIGCAGVGDACESPIPNVDDRDGCEFGGGA